jgi:hypothetical protein
MQTTTPVVIGSAPQSGVPGDGVLGRALAWLGGFFATGAALAIGAILAILAAAAVALIALFGGVFVFFTGMALRARRSFAPRPAPGVIEARKVGHAWVAYGWDRRTS